MRIRTGNVWDFHDEGRWIAITTNIGWKKDGSNPMGAGIAKEAGRRYQDLPAWYGAVCRKYKQATPVVPHIPSRLFLFPTKELNESQPWMSWQADSSIDLIIKSTKQLSKLRDILMQKNALFGDIGVPVPGCGNGNLDQRDVLPILQKHLDDQFVVFCYG